MLEALRNFVAEFVDGGKHPGQFAENDYRLAAVALLVHAATIDGECHRASATNSMRWSNSASDLDDAVADELIDKATQAEHELVDLYHFTSLLNRVLDDEGRARVIEMMWEIVYADGRRDELEDNLLWRAADLLGVSQRQRIELRQRIAAKAGENNGGR